MVKNGLLEKKGILTVLFEIRECKMKKHSILCEKRGIRFTSTSEPEQIMQPSLSSRNKNMINCLKSLSED